eukprot:NODE_904_length_2258_cov_42.594379_g771_i0.p1 GENE.NODE_904_length_2258_cov_42.594379_g771_i0~~NODE_904_length_2258_cov_42.594379_g771_i0.p1  ORF type:complete len:653 (+),score=144.93 NODE_904_length_2258_cov_42.594379_g771_i0:144-1961(+)
MVENPGMVTLSPQEIEENRETMSQIYLSSYTACTTPNGYMPDLIIANPPVHVHTSLAEKFQIPLIISFTMPWEANRTYPHPLATIGSGLLYGNKQSYNVVNEMIWLGLGGEINKFRKKLLQLPPLVDGAHIVSALKVPQIYCFSPILAPPPIDWPSHIYTTGFWMLDDESSFNPDTVPELREFIQSGDPPFYVGFGSIVVENPQKLSSCVIEAIRIAGVRAIVHQGWAKLGAGMEVGPNIFLLDRNVPHDWLFPFCSCVCHHGGAGTTATGLKSGKPTIVVPFFGDQPFWGRMVAERNVGPTPIPHKELTPSKLASAIVFCYRQEIQDKAANLGSELSMENGVEKGCDTVEHLLPYKNGVWTCEAWEYSRCKITGWSTNKDDSYTDKSGYVNVDFESFPLPVGWKWKTGWQMVISAETDSEGWSYAMNKNSNKWKHKRSPTDFVRRRCWQRTRIFCNGNECDISQNGLNSSVAQLVYVTLTGAEFINGGDNIMPTQIGGGFLELSILRGPIKLQTQRSRIERDTFTTNQKFAFRMISGDILYLEGKLWKLFKSEVKGSGKLPIDDIKTFPMETAVHINIYTIISIDLKVKIMLYLEKANHETVIT